MAGDWIEWSKGLAFKREIVFLADKFGRDRYEIAGRLMALWEWCDDNIPDQAYEGTDTPVILIGNNATQFLDALLGLPGMADALSSPEVRWLQPRSGGRIAFPNLGRHNGGTAKTRALERRKKQRQRRIGKGDDGSVPESTGPPDRTKPDNWNWALKNLALLEFKQPPVLLVRYTRLVEKGILKDCEANQNRFFGFAARAIELGEQGDPRRLFVSLLKEWNLEKITNGYADEGSRLLKEALNGQ